MKLRISLAQINVKSGQVEHNLERALTMTQTAAEQGSDIVLLPELWSSGYDLQNRQLYSQQNIAIIEQLCETARQRHLIIGGSIIEEKAGNFYNTFVLINSEGKIQAKYSKIHLFTLMEEDKFLQPGDSLQIACFPFGNIGLAVCYDLRFPEMFRSYAINDVGLILLCAQWPAKRAYHWQTLLRARAIEDQLFFAATNCVGQDGAYVFAGNSAIISPWGETIVEASGTQEELVSGEIDLDQVTEVRRTMTVLSDRKPDLYGALRT